MARIWPVDRQRWHFKVLLAKRYRLPSSKRRGSLSIGPLPLPYKILKPTAIIVKTILKTITLLANFL